jgi:AcrR family transcriptional regulator
VIATAKAKPKRPRARARAVVAPAAGLRVDAQRNRAHVLAIARDVFATEGLAVPIDDIARRAGVGIGTVYRHFPTKEALFVAILQDRMARATADAKAALEAADAGAAFFTFLDRLWRDSGSKKDMMAALGGASADLRNSVIGPVDELKRAVGGLLRRAQTAGDVRAGVDVADVFALMGATFAAAARERGAQARMFAIVVDGLRAPRVRRR